MKKILMLLLSMMALACHAQIATTPTIKGHVLGETFEQFIVKSSPATHVQAQLCIETNDQKRYTVDGCSEFVAFVSSIANGSQSAELKCQDPIYGLGVCRDFRGYAKFAHNKLVELNIEITDKAWSEALTDATSKFGQPDETHSDTVQNVYGAKFDLQTATWTKPDFLVVAFEKINVPYNLNRFIEITLTDHAYFQSEQAKKAHGSALD
ncbi:hypothetical protein [Granulicella mallensis]|uniref:Lipoprotein n=1 Tax=Granulicella mallensis (strain ATCC BAA-1857 / DSM 23137 / MP5ACTX8) TaxID=682795 RepID=G8NQE5_GRAMM|nr:hypothetical protein [Granulicella mallensis]AEU36094.1 hypothetical protein AciX8_1755 [Granulicella mallensis MP5ACTX8]